MSHVICAQFIGRDTVRCGALTVTSTTPVFELCRRLDPALPLEVWRGAVLALQVRSIGEVAKPGVAPHGVGFAHAQACTAAPSKRSTPRSVRPLTIDRNTRPGTRGRRGAWPSEGPRSNSTSIKMDMTHDQELE